MMNTQKPDAVDRIYPCAKCGGMMRTKAEGGTVFPVCGACWDAKSNEIDELAADQSRVIAVLTERIERLRAIMGKVMKRSEEMYTVLKLGDALRDDTNALAEAQRILEGE